MEPKTLGVKMLKNTIFLVFSTIGGATIYLCMVSHFKKCEKQNPVEKCPVIEHPRTSRLNPIGDNRRMYVTLDVTLSVKILRFRTFIREFVLTKLS